MAKTTSTGLLPKALQSVPQRETYVHLDFEPLKRIFLKVGAHATKVYPLVREICLRAGKDESYIMRFDDPKVSPFVDFRKVTSEIIHILYTTFDPSKIQIDSEWFHDGDSPTISVKSHIICLKCADNDNLIAEVYFDGNDELENYWGEVPA